MKLVIGGIIVILIGLWFFSQPTGKADEKYYQYTGFNTTTNEFNLTK